MAKKAHFVICMLIIAQAATSQVPDTTQNFNKWKPSFLRIGYDLARPTGTLFNPRSLSQEISAEVDFHSLFLVTEVGFSDFEAANVDYESNGVYYRVGIDANLIPYDKLRNAIVFSVRYAGSHFQNSLSTNIDDAFGERQVSISESGVTSRWFEAGLGLKVQLIENLYMGYSFRLRFGNSVSGDDQLLPAEVPGFGNAFDDGRQSRGILVGFHYSIFWKIPFWDKPIPIKKIRIPKVRLPPDGEQNLPDTGFN